MTFQYIKDNFQKQSYKANVNYSGVPVVRFHLLLLEDGLGEEEGVCEHDGAVDDGDGAHGQAGVTLRPSHERVVVPGRREGNPLLCKMYNGLVGRHFFLLFLNLSAWLCPKPA